MSENFKDLFKQHNFALSLIPIVIYFLYINYSLWRNPYTGLYDYLYSYVGIPLTFFLSLIVYFITLIFNNNEAVDILFSYIFITLLVLIYKIIYYQEIKIGGKNVNVNFENGSTIKK
jgi:hypothetical protein